MSDGARNTFQILPVFGSFFLGVLELPEPFKLDFFSMAVSPSFSIPISLITSM